MEFKDYYQTLGVARDATPEAIKKAYRKLARQYHPDVSKESDAEARFKELGEAYEVLKDPEKRAAYDQFGSQWKAGQEFRPPPNWDAGFEFRGRDFGGGEASGFSDFFETLFGDMRAAPGHTGRARRPQRGARVNGEDQHAKIVISLEEAFQGMTRTIALPTPGHRGRSLSVKIPRGIGAGQRIRLAGQGAPGVAGGANGDLYLEVALREHPLYRPEGKDIYLELPITPWEAALGYTVAVPTLGGKVELKIPPGAQSGQKLRLKGRGLPGEPPGDQYVLLKIVTPEANTAAARALYEKMAQELPLNPRAALGV